MILTQISQQKRNIENVNLFLDGEYWTSVSKDQLIKLELFKGQDISEKFKTEIEEASLENKIKEKIISYCSYRPRTEKEIKDHLVLKKRLDSEVVSKVISVLKKSNSYLINDAFFSDWFTENKLKNKNWGENKIKQALISKGITVQQANSSLKKFKPSIDENREKIIFQIEKYKGKIKFKNEFEWAQKITQKLISKGFLFDDVRDLVDNYKNNVEY